MVSLMSILTLVSLLQGAPGAERDRAINTVSDTTDSVVRELLVVANWRGRDAVLNALEKAVPVRTDLISEVMVEHPKLTTRRTAMRAFGRVASDDGCDTLAELFGKGSDSVILDVMADRKDCSPEHAIGYLSVDDADKRRRAFVALTKMNRQLALVASRQALKDSHHGVRSAAMNFVTDLGIPGLPTIRAVLKDSIRIGRSSALLMLSGIGAEGIDLLIHTLDSEAWHERLIAVRGLAENEDSKSIKSLEERLLVEENDLVAEALRWTLAGQKGVGHE